MLFLDWTLNRSSTMAILRFLLFSNSYCFTLLLSWKPLQTVQSNCFIFKKNGLSSLFWDMVALLAWGHDSTPLWTQQHRRLGQEDRLSSWVWGQPGQYSKTPLQKTNKQNNNKGDCLRKPHIWYFRVQLLMTLLKISRSPCWTEPKYPEMQ